MVTVTPYVTLSFIFVKFTLCHRPNLAVVSNDCARDCLHKDHCAQAFGRNTLSKPHNGLVEMGPPLLVWRGAIYQKVVGVPHDKVFQSPIPGII